MTSSGIANRAKMCYGSRVIFINVLFIKKGVRNGPRNSAEIPCQKSLHLFPEPE